MNRILGLYIPEPAAERSRGPADHDDRDRSAARRRRLESLAVWATALSPIVHIEGQDTLLVDVTGCQRLFAGEENLLRRAIQGLEENGRAPRGAIADTPGAAWAIAHADARPAVIAPPGRVVSYLAPLPVWSLRIDHAVAARLHAVGVMTIESLLHLPRSSLPARFGEQLGRRLDQALGNEPELLTPYRPRPVVASRLDFTAPTDRVDVLHEALRRALETFCRQLTRRTAGVCRMFVTLSCPDVPAAHGATADAAPANASSTGATPTSAPRTGAAAGADTRCVTRRVNFVLNLSRPTRSLDHLRSLALVVLERPRLPAPADALTVWADRIEPLDDPQGALFATDARDTRALGDLLDRLATRLGGAAVVRAVPVDDHQPERAYRYESVIDVDRTRAAKVSRRDTTPAGPRRDTVVSGPRRDTAPAGPRRDAAPVGPRRDTAPVGPRRDAAPVGSQCDTAPVGPRPLRLARRPIEIATTAVLPQGPPIAFQLHGVRHVVIDSAGPERIETGWWRGPHVARDYYRVTSRAGLRFWVFRRRDTGRWYLHGWFD